MLLDKSLHIFLPSSLYKMRAIALPFQTDSPYHEEFAVVAESTRRGSKQQVSEARHLDDGGNVLFSFAEGAEFPA